MVANTIIKTRAAKTTPQWSQLTYLRRVLIIAWLLAIALCITGLFPHMATAFILGWIMACMAGIGTIAARKNHKT